MRKILSILALPLIIACSGPTDKSIFEDLTVEELKDVIKKDSLFEQTYKNIEFAKDSILTDNLEKVKWSELTYKQIHNLVLFASDTSYFNPLRKKYQNDWEKKYRPILNEVDSVSNYWKKFKEENSLEQYVKVELATIDKEYYSYSGGIKDVNLGFRLTPLKGKIDQMRFSYSIESKLDEDKEKSVYASVYSSLDKSWCRMSRPFSKPTVRYWEASYTNEKILKSRSVKTLLRDYNVYIEVDEIRKDGVNMSNDHLGIPKSIENHWEYENKEYLNDLYVDDVIKVVLGKEYMNEYEYISQKVDSILTEKDKMSYEFLTLKSK